MLLIFLPDASVPNLSASDLQPRSSQYQPMKQQNSYRTSNVKIKTQEKLFPKQNKHRDKDKRAQISGITTHVPFFFTIKPSFRIPSDSKM